MIPQFEQNCKQCEDYVPPNRCFSWCHCKGKGDHCSWHFPEFSPCRCWENKWSRKLIDEYLEVVEMSKKEETTSAQLKK